VLRGSEVKSLREGKVQIAEAFADIHNGEIWLHNLHIPTWRTSQRHSGHDTVRPRKLLLHRREIDRLTIERQTQRIQLIPDPAVLPRFPREGGTYGG
jgi:SsrA-binding protein